MVATVLSAMRNEARDTRAGRRGQQRDTRYVMETEGARNAMRVARDEARAAGATALELDPEDNTGCPRVDLVTERQEETCTQFEASGGLRYGYGDMFDTDEGACIDSDNIVILRDEAPNASGTNHCYDRTSLSKMYQSNVEMALEEKGTPEGFNLRGPFWEAVSLQQLKDSGIDFKPNRDKLLQDYTLDDVDAILATLDAL
ncbi:hypothetical protein JKP88DRAFT_241772 [Tribonema minus]|uniref:Uncharacterized protein n=1 Tax=Tribonema minus TaxID=303371 RepID=A0A835YRH0_9STRA|nr:hypothetical protein JKP88DRAFT_241772 [Tribonema minus]